MGRKKNNVKKGSGDSKSPKKSPKKEEKKEVEEYEEPETVEDTGAAKAEPKKSPKKTEKKKRRASKVIDEAASKYHILICTFSGATVEAPVST